MENSYLVVNPQVPGVTALVHAPSTEKGRTTFLDWLERTKGISRALRGQLRATTITKKIDGDSEGIDYSIELDYGYSPQQTDAILSGEPVAVASPNLPTEVPSQVSLETTQVSMPTPGFGQTGGPPSVHSVTSSPIAQAALNDPVAKLGQGVQ